MMGPGPFFLLVLFLTAAPALAQSDSEILLRFARNVTPFPWNDTSIPVCQWDSIVCSSNLTVINIEFSLDGLSGTLDFSSLPSGLQELHVDQNQFTGTPALWNLPRGLQILDLSQNNFSGSVNLSALPPALQTLDLYQNQLSGTPDLTALPAALQLLDLHENNFSGTPNVANVPPGVQWLDLSMNDFSGRGKFSPAAAEQWCATPVSMMCGPSDAIFNCTGGSWYCQN
jgi:hypothetical protein